MGSLAYLPDYVFNRDFTWQDNIVDLARRARFREDVGLVVVPTVLTAAACLGKQLGDNAQQLSEQLDDNAQDFNRNFQQLGQYVDDNAQLLSRQLDRNAQLLGAQLEQHTQQLASQVQNVVVKLDDVTNQIASVGAAFNYGLNALEARLDGVDHSISQLIEVARSPTQTAAYEHYRIALYAISRNLYEEALNELNAAINGDVASPGYKLEWQFYWWIGHIRLGNVAVDPSLIDLSQAQDAFLKAARYAAAEPKAKNRNDAVDAYLKAGWCAYCMGQMDRALEHTRKAISLNPKQGFAYWQAAKIQMASESPSAALEDLERALDLDSAYADKALTDGDFKKCAEALNVFLIQRAAKAEEARRRAEEVEREAEEARRKAERDTLEARWKEKEARQKSRREEAETRLETERKAREARRKEKEAEERERKEADLSHQADQFVCRAKTQLQNPSTDSRRNAAKDYFRAGRCTYLAGATRQAVEYIEQSLSLARENSTLDNDASNRFPAVQSALAAGMLAYFNRNTEDALRHIGEAIEILSAMLMRP